MKFLFGKKNKKEDGVQTDETVKIAAKNLNRNFLGFELNSKYIKKVGETLKHGFGGRC
jgi:DNA modification methylase